MQSCHAFAPKGTHFEPKNKDRKKGIQLHVPTDIQNSSVIFSKIQIKVELEKNIKKYDKLHEI